jgi:predicted RNA-binding Zn-ribbon protein involved in translation (DUF1610 family)
MNFVCMNCGSVNSFRVELSYSYYSPEEYLVCTKCGDTEIVEGFRKACRLFAERVNELREEVDAAYKEIEP